MKDYLGKEIRTNKKIISTFSKEDFLNYLEFYNIRDIKNNSYENICYNACRYGVMYMLDALGKKNKDLLFLIDIVEGNVDGHWHCWLQSSDYYIDMTIAQFDKKYPELFIIKKTDAKKNNIYSIKQTYTIREWFKWEENN